MLDSVNDSNFIGYCDFDYRCCFEFLVMLRDHFSCLSEDEEIRNAYECLADMLYKRIDYPKCSFYADEKVAVFGTLWCCYLRYRFGGGLTAPSGSVSSILLSAVGILYIFIFILITWLSNTLREILFLF